MTLTIAPSDAACQAIADRINAGANAQPPLYVLTEPANYSRVEIDPLEDLDGLRVSVVHIKEKQLNDLTANENTTHTIQVIIRNKLSDPPADTPTMATLVRQIFLQLDNYDTPDRSVSVWDCDIEDKETPLKAQLKELNLFVGVINLRVEVTR
jgi:hypothetical protein